MGIPYLNSIENFPDTSVADEDGLLAFGGDLSEEWLLTAYKKGIFPWYNHGDPILWWSPNPRMVMPTNGFKISKSFRNVINQKKYQIRFNTDFDSVIDECGKVPRIGQDGTWITEEIREAYCSMHRLGWAHSVEVWDNDSLVGGLYGLAIGNVFFGESMFSKASNTSKLALYYLCENLKNLDFEIIDCQIYTDHLASLGAMSMDRSDFTAYLADNTELVKLEL